MSCRPQSPCARLRRDPKFALSHRPSRAAATLVAFAAGLLALGGPAIASPPDATTLPPGVMIV